jgi:hypothetical protein
MSLTELKELFLKRGLSFVCMTEHTNVMKVEEAEAFVAECERLSDKNFLFIPGFEVPYHRAHVLMIGERNFCGNFARTEAELAAWAESAQFVVLAHPVRNKFVVQDELLKHIDALEVWNQQYEGKRVARTQSLKLFKELRVKKTTLVATGGVDFHRKEHLGAPIITLLAPSLKEESILEKLKEGAYSISSDRASLYGTLPNPDEIISRHRLESALSVAVVVVGKSINKTLFRFGLTLPKSLKQMVRTRL